MVLRLKTRESRSLPGLPRRVTINIEIPSDDTFKNAFPLPGWRFLRLGPGDHGVVSVFASVCSHAENSVTYGFFAACSEIKMK